MKSFLSAAILSLVILFVSSCGKQNEAGKRIPANAGFVAQIDLQTMSKKLSWKDIQQTAIYKKILSDSSIPEWSRKLLENPASSGIDFDNGLVFFTASHNGKKYVAAEGKINNENDFVQFNNNFSAGQPATKDGEVNLLKLKENNVVGWNKNYFIYVMNPENGNYHFGKWDDEGDSAENTPPADRSAEFIALCKNLFSLKADSSLAKNKTYASLLSQKGDMHFYQNNDVLIRGAGGPGMLGMLKLDEFVKDNQTTYTINFENGHVEVLQKMYVGKELTDIVKKNLGNHIDMDMIAKIPSDNVIALLAANFKPSGITEMIKLTGMDGMINSYTQPMGFNLDDFSKATDGNWLATVTDVSISKDSGKIHPDFRFLFSTGIADKPSMNKLLAATMKMSGALGKDSLVNFQTNDKLLAISNSSSFANQYLEGKANSKHDFDKELSGHPVAFYFDVHKVLTQFATVASQKPYHKEFIDESLNLWNNIISTGGEFDDGGFSFHTNINFVNKDSNSLKQLSHYFDQLYLIHQSEKADDANTMRQLDSLLIGPPLDTVK